jgi:hypothetical protein
MNRCYRVAAADGVAAVLARLDAGSSSPYESSGANYEAIQIPSAPV